MTEPMEWNLSDLPSDLLVLAPHPDDEVLGCSLLMRRVAAQSGRIVVVWLTDGGSSHGALDPEPHRRLVERRQIEALTGLSELKITPAAVYFLGYPDGGLKDWVDDARQRLHAICHEHHIDTLVVTDGEDGHADHRAAFVIATELPVDHIYSYPISTRYDGEAYLPPDKAVYVPQEQEDVKRGALNRHRSQSAVEGALYPLSAATIERFCSEPELFIPIRAPER